VQQTAALEKEVRLLGIGVSKLVAGESITAALIRLSQSAAAGTDMQAQVSAISQNILSLLR